MGALKARLYRPERVSGGRGRLPPPFLFFQGARNMAKEIVFVLNDIEKQLAEKLFLNMESGDLPIRRRITDTNDIHSEISYEYRSAKQEKTLQGLALDCRYKLRYRDRNHVFFSAWDCKDVCSVFYDAITLTYLLAAKECDFHRLFMEFDVDLNIHDYVFVAGQLALSFVDIANFLCAGEGNANEKKTYSSQYIFSIFVEPSGNSFDGLLETLKAEGYFQVRILRVWIRGEILYYVLADGLVLRPKSQRSPTAKEERDLIRKILKAADDRYTRTVDFSQPDAVDTDSPMT